MLKQRDLERISLHNVFSHTNDKAVLIPLHKKMEKKELIIVQVPPFLSIFPIGYAVLQRTINDQSIQNHRITESQNGRGWKGPLWVI